MKAAEFDFVQEQRGGDHRAGDAAVGCAEGAERGAGESALGTLHVEEDSFVVADAQDIADGAKLQAFDVAAADHFFVAV